jgi:AcrR family transcriptional regulator
MTTAETRRGPGRPRSIECDAAILHATLEEYAEHGFDNLSVDAVAARAGCSKATIYRRYPTKLDLVITASYEVSHELFPKVFAGNLYEDLWAIERALANKLQHPLFGRVMKMVVGDAARNDEVREMHAKLVRTRRQSTIDALRDAVDRGELRADIDLEVATDMLGGPLFYRHIVTGMPIDDDYIALVIDAFLRAYGT